MKPGGSRGKLFKYAQPSIRAAATTLHLRYLAGPSKFTTTPILSDELDAQGANRAVVVVFKFFPVLAIRFRPVLFEGRKL